MIIENQRKEAIKMMNGIIKLTFCDSTGKTHLHLFRTIAEANQMINTYRTCGKGLYYNFKMEVVKYK